jgi:hypothetical protein
MLEDISQIYVKNILQRTYQAQEVQDLKRLLSYFLIYSEN